MKCNQCNALQITLGGSSAYCHEHGCPNTHKIYDKEEERWVDPEPELEDEYDYPFDDEEEDDDLEDNDLDLGGTGHGDISHSDANPGF